MKPILWTEKELSASLKKTVSFPLSVTGISIDTRTLAPGDLFIAIKGERVDGHQFVADALAKGAVAALVSDVASDQADWPLIQVPDTLQALTDMARYQRAHIEAKYCAVTGSVGKTSTKELLAGALAIFGRTYSTEGNLNNHIGLPLSMARMPRDTAFAVLELGMNHAGEIRFLTQIAQPHIAVITTVDAVHLEFFDSLQGIADAKAEIFEGVVEGGAVVLNADNPFFEHLVKKAKTFPAITRIVGFGQSHAALAEAQLLEYRKEHNTSHITARIFHQSYDYQLGIPGKHQALNSIGVLAVVALLQKDIAAALGFFTHFEGTHGRGKRYHLTLQGNRHVELIDDSYNASPASVRAALDVLSGASGRKIAVLGDMFELGDTAPLLHEQLAESILHAGVDRVFLAGKYMGYLHPLLPEIMRASHVENASQLCVALVDTLADGDTVLVKGSHGMKMHDVVQYLVQCAHKGGI